MSIIDNRLLGGSAGGGGGGDKLYIEDVFSTWLYDGNGSTQTITNGIDLAGKGGLVWVKSRSSSFSHGLHDTASGAGKFLLSNGASPSQTAADGLTSFTSNGFSLGADATNGNVNTSSTTYASWTFRKQAKFFDVVTYTGNGTNRTIAHNLGSVPGTIIVKRTDTTGDWQVYHRSLANTEYMVLNTTAAKATGTTRWNSTTPTSTEFSLGTDATVNANTGTFVAYLFAHDAGGFGDSGNDSVVKCGLASGSTRVDLGWEPQLVLFKGVDAGYNWEIFDNMRGMTSSLGSSDDASLVVNSANAEAASNRIKIDATGFETNISINHIYIAIRRGPMKTPTDATKVFDVNKSTNATAAWTTGFPVDLLFNSVLSSASPYVASRMTGSKPWTRTSSTNAEASDVNNYFAFDATTNTMSQTFLQGGGDYLRYSFRRAPGFFDVVAYTGTGSARTVSHNLGVVPELMIIKQRNGSEAWPVYSASLALDRFLRLNTNGAPTVAPRWNNTAPTASVFSLGSDLEVNGSSSTYIAYLFATCPGVSKVGSYTGTGTTLNIDCGFAAGAHFVLIKRTDSTGDWYVWDTARGIVSGNDPYLLLNSNAAEATNTDYIDPLSSGFQISSTAPAALNANGGTFLYLAIA